MLKKLLCAVALLCAYAGAQTINPNQIRPGTQDNDVLVTMTANQPPTWQQVLFCLQDGTNCTALPNNLQMFVPDPLGTQSVVVPFTVNVNNDDGDPNVCFATSNATSGQVGFFGTGSNLGCAAPPGPSITWSAAQLPPYVTAANVTAIYAVGTVGFNGFSEGLTLTCGDTSSHVTFLMNGSTNGGTDTPVQKPYSAQLTWATGANIGTISCVAGLQANAGGASNPVMNIPSILLRVYYTGTAPPASTALNVTSPLYINTALNALGVSAINLAGSGDGGVIGLLPNANLANPSMTINGTTCTLGSSCTPSGGGGTTTNALTAAATGGAAPGTTFNGSAAVTLDYHSFGAPGISGTPVTGNCADWASATTLGDTGSPCGSGSGGVTQIIAGTNVTISPAGGTGAVTINASGSGGSATTPISPTVINSFGDSVTQGIASSGLFNIWDAYPYKLSIFAGGAVLTDSALSGYYTCDVVHQMASSQNPISGANPLLSTLMVGTNDVVYQPSTSYLNTASPCHSALVSWLGVPTVDKVMGSTATPTGTCSLTDNTLPIGTGASCTAVGSTLTFSVTTNGAPIYIWYRTIDSDTGVWTYSVDGGAAVSVNTAMTIPIHNAPVSGGQSSFFSNSLALIRVPTSSGTHSVVFTATTTGTMAILGVGSLDTTIPASFRPTVAVFDIPHAHLTGTSSFNTTADLYNSSIDSEVTTLSGDGLQVFPISTNTYYSAQAADTTNVCALNACFHPNTIGHVEIVRAFLSKLSFVPQNGVDGAPSLGTQIKTGNYTVNLSTDGFIFDNSGTVTVPSFAGYGREITVYNYSTTSSISLSVGGSISYSPTSLGPLSGIVLFAGGNGGAWFVISQFGNKATVTSSNYTLTPTDNTVFVNSGATITLPSTPTTTGNGGHPITIYNYDASAVSPISGATNGIPNKLLPGQSITIVPSGVAIWWLAASSGGASTVANLPTCSANTAGLAVNVTDGSSPTFLGTITGSGSTYTPVKCNGTNWVAY